MIIFLAFASIAVLTAFAFAIRRLARVPLCPICAGVAGTWAWLLLASWYGVSMDPVLPALLMGGSVVGITYQLERRIRPGHSPLLMKAVLMPLGFLAAYALLARVWPLGLAAAVGIVAASAFFLFPPRAAPGGHGTRERLVKELDDCC